MGKGTNGELVKEDFDGNLVLLDVRVELLHVLLFGTVKLYAVCKRL